MAKLTKLKLYSNNFYKRIDVRISFEASTKKNVGQQKQKLNNLKNNLKAQTKATTTEETENTEKPTYTQVLRKSQSTPKY